MEFLMDDSGNIDLEDIMDNISLDFTNYRLSWRADFIEMGGLDHLFKIFAKLSSKSIPQLSLSDKKILSFLLKVF